MQRILIFGNSGSGKSTLAKSYVNKFGCPHLDLDSLAWQETTPPLRKPVEESAIQIKVFTDVNPHWVIEGCYSDILTLVLPITTQMIFLNPGTNVCESNCKSRPWEPHKYKTPELQEENLTMLLDWVRNYSIREDEFSLKFHTAIFKNFNGNKVEHNLLEKY